MKSSSDRTFDYRDSHKKKGAHYHQGFAEIPYRTLMWEMEQRVFDRILEDFYSASAPDHLDFACGSGRILGYLSDRVASSTGVDVAASMLAVARANIPDATLVECDLTRDDPFEGRAFGLITAFRFFPNAQPALRRDAMAALVRHLAPDGLLVFNNHVNAASLVKRITRLCGRKRPSMTVGEVRRLVDGAGLEIVKAYPLGFLPMTEKWMLRPLRLAKAIETTASRLLPGSNIALNNIYVCRKAVSALVSTSESWIGALSTAGIGLTASLVPFLP